MVFKSPLASDFSGGHFISRYDNMEKYKDSVMTLSRRGEYPIPR